MGPVYWRLLRCHLAIRGGSPSLRKTSVFYAIASVSRCVGVHDPILRLRLSFIRTVS